MKAQIRFQQKLTLIHEKTDEVAIAGLKIVEIPKSKYYPEGLKYSLFLVYKNTGQVIIGFDNHKPKGPHLHYKENEVSYEFKNMEQLVEDFWELVKKEGFIV